MNCEEAKELIQLYLDDELDARSTLSIQQHLKSCTACSNSFRSFATQDQRLKQAANEEALDSSRLRERILDSIKHQTPRSRSYPRWLTHPAIRRAAATVALLLVVSFLLLRGGLFPHVDQQVYAAAASDHIRCTTGARMGEIADADELNRLAARLGKRSISLAVVPEGLKAAPSTLVLAARTARRSGGRSRSGG